ncbi:albumin I [Medicago truncatula]|uniref:Albumin I n=1 Tax=Medicago truncatula TaxID=3880 RepID=A0A072UYJ7_MEDTR|nr:albumin I [Medicago truncatula]
MPTKVIFPMKKVEADKCGAYCPYPRLYCSGDCDCEPFIASLPPRLNFKCVTPHSSAELKKKVEEQPKLCWSHTECTEKGSGNYCARFPNSNLKYGLCFPSISEAVNTFKMASSLKFEKDFLKMSLPA